MPAPPARQRSTRIPWGTSSTSSSPVLICSSLAVGLPGRTKNAATSFFTCLFSARICPRVAPESPRELHTSVRFFVPFARSARMRLLAKPCATLKPAIATVAPSLMSATACWGDATTLSMAFSRVWCWCIDGTGALFCNEAGGLGHLGEYFDIRPKHLVELFRRARKHVEVDGLKLFRELGQPQDAGNLLVHELDDGTRGPAWSQYSPRPVPSPAGQHFRARRHLGQERRALARGDRQRRQLAVSYERQRWTKSSRTKVDSAGDDFEQELRLAFEPHVLGIDTGSEAKSFRVHVGRAARAGRAEKYLAGLGLCERDQLLHRFDAKAGRYEQDRGAMTDLRNAREVLERIVR